MDINLSSADRMIRLVLGTALLYTALLLPNGWGVVLIVVAVTALVNGATGICLIYRMLGISTAPRASASTRRAEAHPGSSGRPRDGTYRSDELVDAVRQGVRGGDIRRLTVSDGDWTVIDIPLTMTPSGVLEVPLLEFLRARAEVAGYSKVTVRH